MLRKLMGAVVGLAVAGMVTTASAVPIVDQFTYDVSTATHNDAGAIGQYVSPTAFIIAQGAQTITVGITGYLSSIDVWVGRQSDTVDDLVLSILSVEGASNFPSTGAALFSAAVAASEVSSSSLFEYSMVSFDMRSANIFLSIGDITAIVLSSPDAPVSSVTPVHPTYSWANTQPGDTYTGGMRFSRGAELGTGYGTWVASSYVDTAVRTWMESAASPEVPLPAAFPLFATALAGMGLLGWRRKRKAGVLPPERVVRSSVAMSITPPKSPRLSAWPANGWRSISDDGCGLNPPYTAATI